MVNSQLSKHGYLFIQSSKQRLLTQGMVESDSHRQETTFTGSLNDLLKHELMTTMNTIKHAYCCYIPYILHTLFVALYSSPNNNTGEVAKNIYNQHSNERGTVRNI